MSDDVSADLAAAMQSMEAPAEKPEAVEEVAAPEPETAAEEATEASETTEAVEARPEEKRTVRAPEGLKPEFKVRFAELDTEWQEEILRREADAARGISQLSEQAKLAKDLDRTIAPYEPMIATMGVGKAELVQNMLQTAYVLNMGSPEQKAAVVRGIMEQYGIQVDQPAAEEVNPEVAKLREELSSLKRMMEVGRGQEQKVVSQQAANDVQAFATDPANEFFEDVRGDMALLMREGRATDLKDAYEKACRMNPEVWKAVELKKQRQGLAEQARVAKAAKASAKQVTGSGPGEERKVANDDPRDDLRALLEKQLG